MEPYKMKLKKIYKNPVEGTYGFLSVLKLHPSREEKLASCKRAYNHHMYLNQIDMAKRIEMYAKEYLR